MIKIETFKKRIKDWWYGVQNRWPDADIMLAIIVLILFCVIMDVIIRNSDIPLKKEDQGVVYERGK